MSVQKKTPDETLAEIDQIMNEIEELQQDMDAAEAPVAKKMTSSTGKPTLKAVPKEPPTQVSTPAAPAADDDHEEHMAEFRSGDSDTPSMEETLGDLKDDEPAGPNLIDQAIGQTEEETMNEDGIISEGATVSDASVSIALSGTMTLKLSYDFGGQEVTIGFVDGALRVELSDGTEFKIPMNRSGELRKTA